jgi:hypothetical protein
MLLLCFGSLACWAPANAADALRIDSYRRLAALPHTAEERDRYLRIDSYQRLAALES